MTDKEIFLYKKYENGKKIYCLDKKERFAADYISDSTEKLAEIYFEIMSKNQNEMEWIKITTRKLPDYIGDININMRCSHHNNDSININCCELLTREEKFSFYKNLDKIKKKSTK